MRCKLRLFLCRNREIHSTLRLYVCPEPVSSKSQYLGSSQSQFVYLSIVHLFIVYLFIVHLFTSWLGQGTVLHIAPVLRSLELALGFLYFSATGNIYMPCSNCFIESIFTCKECLQPLCTTCYYQTYIFDNHPPCKIIRFCAFCTKRFPTEVTSKIFVNTLDWVSCDNPLIGGEI